MALSLGIRLMPATESQTYAYNLLASYLAIQHISEEGLGCNGLCNHGTPAGQFRRVWCSIAIGSLRRAVSMRRDIWHGKFS